MMDPPKVDGVPPAADAPFPTEPFSCPECGQMLAASCRVCVACKAPVDYARIIKSEAAAAPAPAEPPVKREPELARFSWTIFFAVLLVYLSAALFTTGLWGDTKSAYAMGGFVLATSLWVFIDASRNRVPKPAAWAIGCLLMWMVIFPWYLSRRRTPEAPCPMIEGKAGPVARAIFYFLMTFVLIGIFTVIFGGQVSK